MSRRPLYDATREACRDCRVLFCAPTTPFYWVGLHVTVGAAREAPLAPRRRIYESAIAHVRRCVHCHHSICAAPRLDFNLHPRWPGPDEGGPNLTDVVQP
mmetsp:Transcript_50876/g.134615  ORF Transcript_50876/g.134615 Transcript_50876/m.134615 type:complete len:100 (+) Transcript_50876:1210-1509(+)|eukprot:6273377-Prymnesium_polylepis.1